VAGLAEPPLSLEDVTYEDGQMHYRVHRETLPESDLERHLAEARVLLADPPVPARPAQSSADLAVGADFQDLRWFLMPDEAALEMGRR